MTGMTAIVAPKRNTFILLLFVRTFAKMYSFVLRFKEILSSHVTSCARETHDPVRKSKDEVEVEFRNRLYSS